MKNKFFNFTFLFSLFALVLPMLSFAQVDHVVSVCDSIPDSNLLTTFICRIGVVINSIIPILIALGVVYFIWGVISYAIAKDEEAKTKGRSAMIWGLIALLVITSIWGLVQVMKDFIGFDAQPTTIDVVCVPGPGILCPQDTVTP